jgi:hypothetical protein
VRREGGSSGLKDRAQGIDAREERAMSNGASKVLHSNQRKRHLKEGQKEESIK